MCIHLFWLFWYLFPNHEVMLPKTKKKVSHDTKLGHHYAVGLKRPLWLFRLLVMLSPLAAATGFYLCARVCFANGNRPSVPGQHHALVRHGRAPAPRKPR